jgi:hypothetical protein
MIRFLAGGSALFLVTSAMASDGLPSLSAEASCRTVQRLEALPQPVFEACIQDEKNAESQLAGGIWQRAKASSRETCTSNQQGTASQSYVELLTCVQMMEGTTLQATAPK